MNVPKGYKMTEVGVIPEDWEVKRLGDIADIDSDNLGDDTSPDYEFKYISLEDINSGTLEGFTEIKFVSAPSRARRKLKKRDVLFATVRPNLKSHLLFNDDSPDWVCSTGFSVIRCNQEMCLPEYIFFNLFSQVISSQVDALLVGSNYPAVNSKDIKSLKLPIPPLPEQRSIARVLSDTDELINALDKLIAKKRDIKKAVMQELLTGKTRLPGFSGKWEVKRLGDIADITRGASPRPIDSPVWFDDTSSVGWVRISDVTKSSKFLEETTQKLSLLGVKQSRFVNRGNLIMSICATIGRPILTKIDVCIHDGFVVFSNLLIQKDFLYYFLTFIEKNWVKNGQTGSQMNLNTELIKSTTVSYPQDKEEQRSIAQVLSDMDREITALEQRRDKTKAIKQGMMQALLTGRIRLPKEDTNDA